METDIRWKQRLQSYERALATLERGAAVAVVREFSELEEQGLIQGFEFTHELAWNLCRDYLRAQGNQAIHGSKDATRFAFRDGLLTNGEIWMAMIESRNLSSHTYNADVAKKLVAQILDQYIAQFRAFLQTMNHVAEP